MSPLAIRPPSNIYLSCTKVIWNDPMMSGIAFLSLLARFFSSNLYTQHTKLMGVNSLSSTGFGTLGISIKNVALISVLNLPLLWIQITWHKSFFGTSQVTWIKEKLKPSSLGAFFPLQFDKVMLMSSSLNSLSIQPLKFSSMVGKEIPSNVGLGEGTPSYSFST